jgi:hypothetical protein
VDAGAIRLDGPVKLIKIEKQSVQSLQEINVSVNAVDMHPPGANMESLSQDGLSADVFEEFLFVFLRQMTKDVSVKIPRNR